MVCISTSPRLLEKSSNIIRKFWRADFSYVRFGEFADAIKRILQLLLIAFKVFLAGLRRNWDELAEAHQNARKRFRDNEAVPGVENPGVFDCDVERAQGNAGRARQRDRAGLYLVARAARAVDAEGDGPALLQGAAQAEQGAHGVAATGAFDGDEAESVDDTSHVFAVVAVAAHHADAGVAEEVSGGNDDGVPEIEDQRPLADALLRALFARDAHAQRRSDETDEPVSSGDDDAQDYSLAEGEAAGTGHNFGCRRRLASAGFGHEGIVTGRCGTRRFARRTAESLPCFAEAPSEVEGEVEGRRSLHGPWWSSTLASFPNSRRSTL